MNEIELKKFLETNNIKISKMQNYYDISDISIILNKNKTTTKYLLSKFTINTIRGIRDKIFYLKSDIDNLINKGDLK
jgi:hypothetical protein